MICEKIPDPPLAKNVEVLPGFLIREVLCFGSFVYVKEKVEEWF